MNSVISAVGGRAPPARKTLMLSAGSRSPASAREPPAPVPSSAASRPWSALRAAPYLARPAGPTSATSRPVQPIFDAIEAIALYWESYSLWRSNTIRTARSRTSGEYLLGLPMMTPILSSNGVSGKPGEVHGSQIRLSRLGRVSANPVNKVAKSHDTAQNHI